MSDRSGHRLLSWVAAGPRLGRRRAVLGAGEGPAARARSRRRRAQPLAAGTAGLLGGVLALWARLTQDARWTLGAAIVFLGGLYMTSAHGPVIRQVVERRASGTRRTSAHQRRASTADPRDLHAGRGRQAARAAEAKGPAPPLTTPRPRAHSPGLPAVARLLDRSFADGREEPLTISAERVGLPFDVARLLP